MFHKYAIYYHYLYDKLNYFKLALLNIKKGYLDPYFIKPVQMMDILTNIDEQLSDNKSNLQIMDYVGHVLYTNGQNSNHQSK